MCLVFIMRYEVFWKNPRYRERAPLKGDVACRYLIVGGGVTGVSLAYFLARAGAQDVVLIEKERIAGGATGKAAGILTPHAELDVRDMLRVLGKEKGLLWYHASLHALHLMKHIVRKEQLRCEFEEEPALYAVFHRENAASVFDEYRVLKADHQRIRLLLHREVEQEMNIAGVKEALLIYDEASMNPLKYTQQLSRQLGGAVRVYEHTPLLTVRRSTAHTPQGRMKFEYLIDTRDVASDAKGVQRCLSTIVVSSRLSMAALRHLEHRGKFILWDAKKNYDYVKVTRDRRLLLGFGDVRSARRQEQWDREAYAPHVLHLQQLLRTVFPDVPPRVAYAWSGILGVTQNYLPFVRFSGKRVVLAGTSSQVVSTLVAQYVAQRLLGKKQALDALFKK